jgi:hypothetical protein
LAVAQYLCQPKTSLEEVMENFTELMHRLLEIQSDGKPRSPKLIAEDERLRASLQKRSLVGKPRQTAQLGQDSQEQTQCVVK